MTLCKCGCGQEVPINKRKDRQAIYINHHSRRGTHHTEQTKEQMKNSWDYIKHFTEKTKIKMSEVRLGKSTWNKGKKCPSISKSKKGISVPNRQNKNHWNWKGGIVPLQRKIRNSPKMLEWKAQIRGRDNWTCQKCGCKGWMEAHHIKKFADIIEENNIKSYQQAMNCNPLWELNNGITYCKACHKLLNNGSGLL